MIVATIALIAAVSGSAYAALAKNSVGSKQLKKGAVKTVDIGKDAVTGKKAKESSFSRVPSARRADTATSFGGMSATRIEPLTLGNGESEVLDTFGPFTLTASCTINLGGIDTARVEITTSENNSAFKGEDEDSDFDVGDAPVYVEASTFTTGTPSFQEDGGAAVAPSGAEMLGHQLYAGVNVLGAAASCRFGGVIFSS